MTTFALGGSLSGYLNKQILNLVFLEKNAAYWLIYPLLLTVLWPFSVILVSFLTGQFLFFKGYLGRIWGRLTGGGAAASPIHVAIFASGAGSNAKKIIEYFENKSTPIKISLIVCNVPGAGVLEIAKSKGIPTLLINKTEFTATGYVESLHNADIHFIVLAGFLWKVPEVLVNAYQPGMKIDSSMVNGKTNTARGIINIHPALLPNYGGKGMYGARVHEAVVAAGEKETGITIHWVDAHYDEGDIIFQTKCGLDETDTPSSVADKIHALEHAHFAPTIERILLK
ncbi:MAG: phosphoribosylglycinamide formyltransferase [Sediminibacterium sp.]|nr:phosphoribosylglycinamide formyltransferase [Sediminibacterium sp.]